MNDIKNFSVYWVVCEKEGDLISSLLELKNGYLVLSLLNSNLAWPCIGLC